MVQRDLADARARGDIKHQQDCEKLLAEWALLFAQFAPANDLSPPLRTRPPTQVYVLESAAKAEDSAQGQQGATLWPKKLGRVVVREAGCLWLALRDQRTPWYAKAVLILACLLAVSPVDFTPDLIPQVGFLDDPTILVIGTLLAVQLVSPLLISEFRERAASLQHARALKGSFAICSIWLAAVVVTMLHGWRPVA